MPISLYCATQFPPKEIGYMYTLRNPFDGYIFYVGKTYCLQSRYWAHLSDRKAASEKGKYIKDIIEAGSKPVMGIIESMPVRTQYDSYYYDYKEFYWIRNYLEYGWKLTNVRINDVVSSETSYKKILAEAAEGGKLQVNAFYYDLDAKGFPIYDLKMINKLGYHFSASQYASHWAYVIDIEKYSNFQETTLDYTYSDIECEETRIRNFDDLY